MLMNFFISIFRKILISCLFLTTVLAYAAPKNGLVAHYKLDGNALDASINKNHGSVFQAKSALDRNGKSGGALSFDGIDDYVSLPDVDNLDFSINQDFSISIWVKVDSLQKDLDQVDNEIVEKWSGIDGYPYVIRYLNQKDKALHGKISVARFGGWNNGGDFAGVTSKQKINDGFFHHIVLIKSEGMLYLYIDNNIDSCFKDLTSADTTNNSPVYIGRRGSNDAHDNFLSGVVDELIFYNRSLSLKEVGQLYNETISSAYVNKNHICPKSVDELVEEIEELQVIDFEIPFEGNHWRIQESAKKELDKLGKVLSSNKLTSGSFELVGHVAGISGTNKTCIDDNHKFVRNSRYAKECWETDADWAMVLSERRANSVKDYLVDNFSVAENRIKAYGVGNTQHKISDPDNPGNRRVEVKYIKNK